MTDQTPKTTKLWLSEKASQQLKQPKAPTETNSDLGDIGERTRKRSEIRSEKRETKQALINDAVKAEGELVAVLDHLDAHQLRLTQAQSEFLACSKDHQGRLRGLQDELSQCRLRAKEIEWELAELHDSTPMEPRTETSEQVRTKARILREKVDVCWSDLHSHGLFSPSASQKARNKYGDNSLKGRIREILA